MRKFAVMLMVLLLLLAGCGFRVPVAESIESVSESSESSIAEEHFSLLASLPEDDIYLYGIGGNGFMLFQDGCGRYFDWNGVKNSNRGKPRLKYADFDGDGVKEIAVIECITAFTDDYFTKLHVLKIEENYSNRIYSYKDYTVTVYELLDEDDFAYKNGTAFYKGEAIGKARGSEDSGGIVGRSFGELVYFSFDENDGLVCKAVIGYRYQIGEATENFTDMVMNISFDGEGFNIDNYHFTNDDYESF